MHTQTNNDLLPEDEAADVIDVKKHTLQAWRSKKKGPAFIKIGSKVRYRRDDLLAYLDANRIVPSSAE